MRIFGCKSEELTGEYKKLHNEELRNLYICHILLGWWNQRGWERQAMKDVRDAHKISVEILQVRRPLGRSRYRWQNNIKLGLGKNVWMCKVDWTEAGRVHMTRFYEHGFIN